MKNVFTIIKKEFSRFFKDRRMIISILLPGILIFVLYSLLGTVFSNLDSVDEDYKPTACIIEMPSTLLETLNSVLNVSEENLAEEQAKEKISSGELDILVVFTKEFDSAVAGNAETVPNVGIFYNSSYTNSNKGFMIVNAILSSVNKPSFTVNVGETKFDLADEKDITGSMLAMLVPMVMFSLLASAGMMVAPESIAGEKERGTIATLLITPIKRWQLALGKILSLSCFAILSGLSSFLGVILSLPKLTVGMLGAEAIAFYSFGDYLMILGVIISTVLLIVSMFSVISCFAKSVKESGSLIAPFMIVIILMGMFSMFLSGTPATGLFAVPLMGSGLAISGIMSFTATPIAVVLSIISNLVVTVLLTVLLAFMFRSEKIMFRK